MTWGMYGISKDGAGCETCNHVNVCRQRLAARTGQPVLCEDGGHVSRGYGDHLLEILGRTDGMTATELARAAGTPRIQASNWCRRGCKHSRLEIVGSRLYRGKPVRVYGVRVYAVRETGSGNRTEDE